MKAGLDAAGLKPFLMVQPLAYHTPDAGKQGFIDLPEFPFGLEPRICTRWDNFMQQKICVIMLHITTHLLMLLML